MEGTAQLPTNSFRGAVRGSAASIANTSLRQPPVATPPPSPSKEERMRRRHESGRESEAAARALRTSPTPPTTPPAPRENRGSFQSAPGEGGFLRPAVVRLEVARALT